MAFPDSTWPCGYDRWYVDSLSPEEVKVDWYIDSFLRECLEERKELRSYDFGFAGATWNLFTSFDRQKVRSLFGINVKPHRFSNALLDCNCEIAFISDNFRTIKKIDLKFNCENADSHSAVTNFFSNSELDMFLESGWRIKGSITVKKSSIKKECPEISLSSSSSTDDAHTLTQMPPNDSVAFSDSSWSCGCDRWWLWSSSPESVEVHWHIGSFLRECQEGRKELSSYKFGFADATWNLFTSLDGKEAHSLFGINVKPLRLPDAVFDCHCEIIFRNTSAGIVKKFECKFKCGSAESYWAVQNLLSKSELNKFLQKGKYIVCTIKVKNSSIKEVCPEIAHSSCSGAVEGHTQLQHLERSTKSTRISAVVEDSPAKKRRLATPTAEVKEENSSLKEKLADAESSAARYCQAVAEMKKEIKVLKNTILENQKKHNEIFESHQIEGNEALPMASFESKVCKDFRDLLLSEEDYDVTLEVQDQKFKAHRLILTARSSVFASMFRLDTKEKATGVVNVEDSELSVFPVLLEFIYCGSTEKLSVDNMFGLYVSADNYDLQDLKMKCLQLIKSNLSVDTFCKTLHLSLQHSEADLLKLATEFFIRNCQQITLNPEWQIFLSENPIQGNELFIKAISLNPR